MLSRGWTGAQHTGAKRRGGSQGSKNVGRAVPASPDRDEFGARATRRNGTPLAHGARGRAVRTALSAEGRGTHRQDYRRRGIAALARPREWNDRSRDLFAATRVGRPDDGDRCVGVAASSRGLP